MPSKRWASPCSSSSSKKGAGTRPSSTQTSGEASFQCLPLRWNKRRSSSVPLHIKHSCSLHVGRRVSVGLSPPKVAGGGLMQRQVRQTVPRASSSSGRCPRNISLVTSRRSAAGKEVCSISAASMWRRSQGCQRARMAALYRAWRSSTVSLASKSLAAWMSAAEISMASNAPCFWLDSRSRRALRFWIWGLVIHSRNLLHSTA